MEENLNNNEVMADVEVFEPTIDTVETPSNGKKIAIDALAVAGVVALVYEGIKVAKKVLNSVKKSKRAEDVEEFVDEELDYDAQVAEIHDKKN